MSGNHEEFVKEIAGFGGGAIVESVVGTVLRLERDAWSTVKIPKQATNDPPPPPMLWASIAAA